MKGCRHRAPSCSSSSAHRRTVLGAAAGWSVHVERRAQPITKPITKPITVGDGPAPGCPCKCTPFSPAVCLTTPPPRCDEWWWSSSPWGWLSISRGNPGPELVDGSAGGAKGEVEKKKLQNSTKTKPVTGGLVLESAPVGAVIAIAIEERCAFCGSDHVAGGAGVQRAGKARGRAGRACRRTVIASAIGARCACDSDAGARATGAGSRR
jgi:hypothetical protein